MTPTLASDALVGSGSATGPHSTRRLLVVDDDLSVRQALWMTFHDLYSVTLAESGPAGLAAFREHSPDVAVLDIRMPGMTGLEVLKQIKTQDPDVEVILLTGYETVEYIREAMRLGACDYITKPYHVETLRTAVDNAMERREIARKTAAYDKKLAQLQREMHHQQIREELARTRNEIYASIIHDLNGPLTVIAGYVELMQDQIRHANVLEADQLVTLRNQTESVSRHVANCIEVSRRYLGFLEGKFSSNAHVGVRELLYDVAELLKAHPQARANELIIQRLNDDTEAAVHGTDLLQVVLNLTINALQCSPQRHKAEVYAKILPPGTPRTFLQQTRETRLLAAADFAEQNALVAISVQDNGPGIPEHLLDKIFEPYFTTKAPGQGTGLGLAIVRRLVLQSRSAVHVYSHPGDGTVFTVYLPVRNLV